MQIFNSGSFFVYFLHIYQGDDDGDDDDNNNKPDKSEDSNATVY